MARGSVTRRLADAYLGDLLEEVDPAASMAATDAEVKLLLSDVVALLLTNADVEWLPRREQLVLTFNLGPAAGGD